MQMVVRSNPDWLGMFYCLHFLKYHTFLFEKKNYLSTDFVCVNFTEHNLKDLHKSLVLYSLTYQQYSYRIYSYVYDLSPYQLPHA
jgi:hypothetical protein